MHERLREPIAMTVSDLLTKVQNIPLLPRMGRTTLYLALREHGFTFRTNKRNMAMLLEKTEGRNARFRFYQQFEQFLEEGRPMYFMDETWV